MLSMKSLNWLTLCVLFLLICIFSYAQEVGELYNIKFITDEEVALSEQTRTKPNRTYGDPTIIPLYCIGLNRSEIIANKKVLSNREVKDTLAYVDKTLKPEWMPSDFEKKLIGIKERPNRKKYGFSLIRYMKENYLVQIVDNPVSLNFTIKKVVGKDSFEKKADVIAFASEIIDNFFQKQVARPRSTKIVDVYRNRNQDNFPCQIRWVPENGRLATQIWFWTNGRTYNITVVKGLINKKIRLFDR